MTFQLQTDKNPFPFPIIFIGMNPIKAGAQSRTKNNIHSIRAKILHPLLDKLGIPRCGFHSLIHGAASALRIDGASPTAVQKRLRDSCPLITLGVYAHAVGNQQRGAREILSARIAGFAVNELVTFDTLGRSNFMLKWNQEW